MDQTDTNEEEQMYRCLEACVQRLTPGDRELILQYYQGEGQAKIDHRKDLARQLGIPLNALRIKVHRIRATLQQWVRDCSEPEGRDEMDQAKMQ